jgi:hypothetical protein
VADDSWELQLTLWILEALENEGGEAEIPVVIVRVGDRLAKLDDRLNRVFSETLSKFGVSPEEGESFRRDFLDWAKGGPQMELRPTWKEDLKRVADRLMVAGHLQEDSPKGMWQISRKGMTYLMGGALIEEIRKAGHWSGSWQDDLTAP